MLLLLLPLLPPPLLVLLVPLLLLRRETQMRGIVVEREEAELVVPGRLDGDGVGGFAAPRRMPRRVGAERVAQRREGGGSGGVGRSDAEGLGHLVWFDGMWRIVTCG